MCCWITHLANLMLGSTVSNICELCYQWRRHTRANALAEMPPPWLPPWQSKVVIINLYIKIFFTALAAATNDLSMPCHDQKTGAATVRKLHYAEANRPTMTSPTLIALTTCRSYSL